MSWCFQMRMQLPKGTLNYVDKWPMMNPNELAFMLITYLGFVLKVGPVVMETRPAFKLNKVLVAYNIMKIINSIVLTSMFFTYLLTTGLFPNNCDHDEATVYTVAMLYWKYMITKLVDLIDTVFFVIRKKHDQVTFLHVYHHTFMVLCSWTALKYDPSDHWAFMAAFNCLIHTAMYTYYCLAALGPSYARYLWWKRYLTVAQLIQFVLVLGHVMLLTYLTQCPMHAVSYWVGCGNLSLFIILFGDFYMKRYRQPLDKKNCVGFACVTQNNYCD